MRPDRATIATRAEQVAPRPVARLSIAGVALALVGCATFQGRAAPTRARIDEADGVRVLYDAPARGSEGEIVTADENALDGYLTERGIPPVQPPIDFRTHVVIGASRWTEHDPRPIVGVTIDEHARVTTFARGTWVQVAVLLVLRMERRTTLLAIPRRMLPPPGQEVAVALSSREVRARVPPLPRSSAAGAEHAPRAAHPTETRGVVALPSVGHLALRTLDDGSDVWVVRHEGGAIDVLAADVLVSSPDEVAAVGVRYPVGWIDVWRTLGGHDAHGGPQDGEGEPLDVHAFERLEGDRVRIGERLPGVPRARAAPAPLLEGVSAWPYRAHAPIALDALAARPHGSFARVDAEVRIDATSATLCEARDASDPTQCAGRTLPVRGITPHSERMREYVIWLRGPLVVRWRGDAVDHVVAQPSEGVDVVRRP